MTTLFAKARAHSNRLYALSPRCTPNSLFPITDVQRHPQGWKYLLRLSPTHHAWIDTHEVELLVIHVTDDGIV
ncbi:hypothetical protein [Candidatus Cyanaurora vandensis]|uniref:hypothetical protein n=1 Tax=Candidatus Cyanaurora vandensis TaxID=2714958 RepID=UPI00257B7AB7|nr:hypothetical protein [Candidatus Cyanaurora vandensis]